MSFQARPLAKQISTWCSLALVAVVFATGMATAGPVVAIVEDADPLMSSVAAMDYLERGRMLDLAATGWVEIGYFASCTQERIIGGVVRVGADRSEVSGGTVDRRQVKCDKDNLAVSQTLGATAAGSAQRTVANSAKAIRVGTEGELKLYSAAPLVVTYGAGEVEISRLLDPRDRQMLKIEGAAEKGSYDFALNGRALQRGAVYRATFGDRTIVFRIDRDAPEGASEMLGRLIFFPPEQR